LAIKRKIHGRDHPDNVVTLRNLALNLHAEGDLAGSQAFFEEALAVAEKTFGEDHDRTNLVRRNFARLLLVVGKFGEALRIGAAALAATEKTLGPDHNTTKDAADIAVGALRALGRDDEAAVLRARYGLPNRT
jgi:tetratricopeptide (TPR) repeat protein